MAEIKHILYQSGTYEVFKLEVLGSSYDGIYEIVKPDGWDEIDAEVSINEEVFNVDDFILGATNKLKFLEYNDKPTFDLLKRIYEEVGNDAQVFFKWYAHNGTDIVDLLGDGFELNFNKYNETFEKSAKVISLELKKRDSQNKILVREDSTVDLFSEKSLDNETITPATLTDIVYKEGSRKLTNFYFMSVDAKKAETFMHPLYFFPYFNRSEDYQFGDNKNEQSGYVLRVSPIFKGPLLSTNQKLENINLEISNLDILLTYDNTVYPNVSLVCSKYMNIKQTPTEEITLAVTPTNVMINGKAYTKFKITNENFELGDLEQGENLSLFFKNLDNLPCKYEILDEQTSLSLSIESQVPTRKTQVLKLKEALNQLVKNYTSGASEIESTALSNGGIFANTGVTTGQFLRGIGNVPFFQKKLKTSLKSALYDGSAPLMALGFDILSDKVVVEDIDYFFKNVVNYDFTDKEFLTEDYSIDNDLEASFSTLLFGSKKYSTKNKRDLQNYNTTLEATTPIITRQNKFDKKTDCIIDEYKIAELIADNSTSTNDNDDDLVLIDLVTIDNYTDSGVLQDCQHSIDGGYLVLICYDPAFDLLPLKVGDDFSITDGVNAGTYEILEIDRSRIKLNKTSGITEGNYNTPVSFTVSNVTKNRTNEGFSALSNIKDIRTCTNLRHNPKFQLARWFGFFGGGLNKKPSSKEIIINNYKNNGKVVLSATSPEMANELQGINQLDVNLTLQELRQHKIPYFSGKTIEITISDVLFYEFLECFNNWRYGNENNRANSRGFIKVNTPDGIAEIYPFGSKALSYNRSLNELTIKGKIKSPIFRNRIFTDEFTQEFS